MPWLKCIFVGKLWTESNKHAFVVQKLIPKKEQGKERVCYDTLIT